MTAEKEKLLNLTYDTLVNVAAMGDSLQKIQGLISERFMGYGTAPDEVLYGMDGFIAMVERQRAQLGELKTEINRHDKFRNFFSNENSALIVEEIEITVRANESVNTILMRLSTILEYTGEKWMVLHFHASTADANTMEGEAWPIEEWKRRNMELQKLVDEKTALLQLKYRELEIEASLERVRAVAIGMHKPGDLVNICKVLFKELHALGFSELRNTLIHTFVDEQKYFNDHDYSDDTGSAISHTPYSGHPVIERFIKEIRSTNDAFSEIIITGKELEEWKKFRTDNGQAHDPRLDAISALYYYNYSVGPASIGISTFNSISNDKRELLKRFRNVFDFAYRRYTDVTQAEAQAREAKIEAALERVRSRAMAMQASEELNALIGTVFTELTKLDLVLTRCVILIYEGNEKGVRWWMANSEAPAIPMNFFVKYADLPFFNSYLSGWNERTLKWQYFLEEGNKIVTDDFLFSETELSQLPDFVIAGMKAPEKVCLSASFNNFGCLTLAGLEPLPDEHFDILLRFAKVFDLTYTRFNDLKQAEAQAREAKIEAALERVRSKAMAMHKSEDLNDAVAIVFEELEKLDLGMLRCGIGILNREKKTGDVWTTAKSEKGNIIQVSGDESLEIHPLLQGAFDAWLNQEDFSYVLQGDDMVRYYRALTKTNFHLQDSQLILTAAAEEKQYYYVTSFESGTLFAFRETVFPEEAKLVMNRFAGVFNLTYKRFLDLQKAEANAREAQIEASLERVRAKAMAMHNSPDVSVVTATMFNELTRLGVESMRCGVAILQNDSSLMDVWAATVTKEGHNIKGGGIVDTNRHPLWINMRNDWKAGKESFFYHLKGDDLKAYYAALTNSPNYSAPYIKNDPPEHFCYTTFFDDGVIFTFNQQIYSDEQKQILKRFASVFSLTYKRYKDLKKAEAQARQARIEAALEKVRSRAMAMQKPAELIEVAQLLRTEMGLLGVEELETSSIYIHNETTQKTECWYAIQKDKNLVSDHMTIDLQDTWVGREMLAFYCSDEKKTSIIMQGEARKEWINYCADHSDVLVNFYGAVIPDRTYHLYKFSNGYMGAASPGNISAESWDLLQRATSVFSLAYTRFSDLQQAEAQAKEAQTEAALERVRSRTLAMQKSDELAETAAILFKQMINLGIAPNRLYIGIINDESGDLEFWITDEDGNKVSQRYIVNVNKNISIKKMYEGWAEKKKSITINMEGEELLTWLTYWNKEFGVPFKKGPEQKRRIQNISYFSKGFIAIASPDDQPEETTQLLERFAAVFNLTFTRFNDLKIAEAHAEQAELDLLKLKEEKKRTEDALAELQVTQKQLIQSEKMASLGELTAGIAHEIQNPLNFVNNFSEVSNELIDEMMEAVAKGNYDDAKAIADDVKQNLEKINHHGKRADGIVKGMLQHSRSSSGVMEPTDINVLADEYLRLAYHGLRAKDKSFNATMKTDYDKSIGNINIIPQDIGRAILNLITNAFYAASLPSKGGFSDTGNKHDPTVWLNTKKVDDKVLISVRDNGPGIPQKILDKIFQPFFTTKPTGQGTGLGLSLSYDIVKAHGGELRVETPPAGRAAKESDGLPGVALAETGSEFIITIPFNNTN